MIHGFFGRVSSANQLKGALDVGSRQTRAIADRVAKATLGNQDGFALPDAATEVGDAPIVGEPVDLEAEMVSLADQQLRFEATARLLQKAYEQIRLSIRDR
jgi:flagellar basal body rod protein FlgB